MPRSPSGIIIKGSVNNQAAYSKASHADDKEGTISSCGQSDSLNRPNINARLRSTSALDHHQRLPFHGQRNAFETYLKEKEEVLMTPQQAEQRSTMRTLRSGCSDPAWQAHDTERTAQMIGAEGAPNVAKANQIPEFERTPKQQKVMQAHGLPESTICFHGMPKYQTNLYCATNHRNFGRMHNARSNEDFQTPRSGLDQAGRNKLNTHRQGSQNQSNCREDGARNASNSLMTSLCCEKLSNLGALASNCRPGTRLETLSVNQTPKIGSASETAQKHNTSQRKPLPYQIQSSKSLSQARMNMNKIGKESRTASNDSIS